MLFFIAALYVCVLVAMRSRIQLAIGIIKEAARALQRMPMLALLPVLECVGVLLFLLVWLVYAAYLASSGEIQTVSSRL